MNLCFSIHLFALFLVTFWCARDFAQVSDILVLLCVELVLMYIYCFVYIKTLLAEKQPGLMKVELDWQLMKAEIHNEVRYGIKDSLGFSTHHI